MPLEYSIGVVEPALWATGWTRWCLAGRVLLKIAYVLTCRILGLVVLLCRGDRVKDAELLVVGHENAVLRRQSSRVRYDPADRVWFTAPERLLPHRRWADVFPLTPATLLAWHRRLAAKKYDTSKRRKPGRPPTVPGIARLVVRLARENPLYVEGGHRRIHGELTKLTVTIREGVGVAAQVLVKLGADPTRVRRQVIQLLQGSQGNEPAAAAGAPSET